MIKEVKKILELILPTEFFMTLDVGILGEVVLKLKN